MPIRPEDKQRYPVNWPQISRAVKEAAGWRCECAGECGRDHGRPCGKAHGEPGCKSGAKIVLTTAHLDHTPEHCDPANLRAWCQACHLAYDRDHHAATRARTRAAKAAAGHETPA